MNGLAKDLKGRLTNATEFQTLRISRLMADIDSILNDFSLTASKKLSDDLIKFAEYESDFQARLLGQAVTVETILPTAAQVAGSLTKTPALFASGEMFTIDQMIENFALSKSKKIRNILNMGIVEGKPSNQIVLDIVGKGAEKKIKAEAEALVRTATTHAASTARNETMAANADILEGEKYSATLDSRTTIECASLDGRVFTVGEGPMPPIHYRCRSTRVPVVKKQFQIPGLEGQRASYEGPVSTKTTYNSFLKNQSKEFQDDVLGQKRADLFRSGMNISKFTDDNGKLLTLRELKLKEGFTF
jgi:SPP1 gp7 family putative phage head morphogenesis protein